MLLLIQVHMNYYHSHQFSLQGMCIILLRTVLTSRCLLCFLSLAYVKAIDEDPELSKYVQRAALSALLMSGHTWLMGQASFADVVVVACNTLKAFIIFSFWNTSYT